MEDRKKLIRYLMENIDEFFNPPGFEVLQAPYLEIGKEYVFYDSPLYSDEVFNEDKELFKGILAGLDLEGKTLTLEKGIKAVVHSMPLHPFGYANKRVLEPFERETFPFSEIFTSREKQ